VVDFQAGDIVQLVDTRIIGQTDNFGRLQYTKQYEVLRITKQGHLLIQTKWGKTHYSKNLFKLIRRPSN
jgi:hypothetical protein